MTSRQFEKMVGRVVIDKKTGREMLVVAIRDAIGMGRYDKTFRLAECIDIELGFKKLLTAAEVE